MEVVQTEVKDALLMLARRPPSCILDVLLHGRSRWRLVQAPFVTRPRGQRPGPRSQHCTFAVVAARRPQWMRTTNAAP